MMDCEITKLLNACEPILRRGYAGCGWVDWDYRLSFPGDLGTMPSVEQKIADDQLVRIKLAEFRVGLEQQNSSIISEIRSLLEDESALTPELELLLN